MQVDKRIGSKYIDAMVELTSQSSLAYELIPLVKYTQQQFCQMNLLSRSTLSNMVFSPMGLG
jgi:hypothetical protein